MESVEYPLVEDGVGLITVREAQVQYGVGRATIFRYVQQGRLRTYRRGFDRRTYVSADEIERVKGGTPVKRKSDAEARFERFRALERQAAAIRASLGTPVSVVDVIDEGRRERDGAAPGRD